ncbi:MAG: tRNA dihydrouridine(20/20a) synthase DusA [Pseudomonadota bacterium]|nr:tRNA dihydrouridine(20/20a) synthase DusA [Pseudomonadota bacterium]
MDQIPGYLISVAPMMEWTDRHCRYMLRCITRRVLLYTEMVTTEAILRGNRDRLLSYDASEHPVALQLGGSDPAALEDCARIGADWGYDEINLNVGCPSSRVQSGRFGACLMRDPDLVGRCIERMARAVEIPITVKSRIGVDEQDEWSSLSALASRAYDSGATRLIVHARKAWLKGLNPKQNREVPPLRYDIVYRLKTEMPNMPIIVNGGICTLDDIDAHLARVDGVMLGRAVYQDPFILAAIERNCFASEARFPSRRELASVMLEYIERELLSGTPLRAMTRHMLGIFHGFPGARAWRHCLSNTAHRTGAPLKAIQDALNRMPVEHTVGVI